MNLSWWLERASAEYPQKTAIVDASGASITYAELKSLVDRIGHVLRDDMGVQPDDVVVTCMPDNYLHVAIMFATMRIGAMSQSLQLRPWQIWSERHPCRAGVSIPSQMRMHVFNLRSALFTNRRTDTHPSPVRC